VDLCRQSIVFEHVADLVACLRIIGEDSEAELLRIKNRLDPACDAAATAGYRNVGLNLRIATGETRGLGLHWHVCEVQLLLLPFAKQKVPR
jgi:hypothetical protein